MAGQIYWSPFVVNAPPPKRRHHRVHIPFTSNRSLTMATNLVNKVIKHKMNGAKFAKILKKKTEWPTVWARDVGEMCVCNWRRARIRCQLGQSTSGARISIQFSEEEKKNKFLPENYEWREKIVWDQSVGTNSEIHTHIHTFMPCTNCWPWSRSVQIGHEQPKCKKIFP